MAVQLLSLSVMFGRFCFIRSVVAVLGLVFVQGGAHAVVLLDEPFNYTNAALVTASAGQWSTHSGATGEVEVLGGRANLSAQNTEDVNHLLAGQPYPATTGTVLYASFIVNFSLLPSLSGEYFAHFKDTTTSNFRAKLFALTSGADSGQFRIGIANSNNAPSVVITSNLNLNTDYRIYVRYGISNAVATLWIDPTSESSPSVSATDPATARTIVSFALRQSTGIGDIALDDLRVGTTFVDVYSPPPVYPPGIALPPTDTAVVEGGAAVFTVTAVGSSPLAYQWKFNGSNLIGATNTTLTLSDVTLSNAGSYSVVITNVAGSTSSPPAALTVIPPNASNTLSLVHYNVKGNFASDWSTNAAQVQAIARQLQFLSPDIITLNEIPNTLRYEMTNWMIAFFPGQSLAISSGTDGAIRSAVISRFPIARSQSWLDAASLTNFGYAGTFTRDLFEVEVVVPGAVEPLHVFTTHLKSGSDADSQDRRAAECSVISNFFVTVFIPTNGHRPYLLTGDLNEDIQIPMSHSNQPIQRLIATSVGLHLTTPLNPFTFSRFTHSIQGSMDARLDYILPAGVLASNVLTSQVFRTDVLPELEAPLMANDAITASDHLPVQMIFNYPDPQLHVSISTSNQTVTLNWLALVGREFNVESSANLTMWSVIASNIPALAVEVTWTTSATNSVRFYRVVRMP